MNMQELRNHLERFLAARAALGFKDRGRKSLLADFLRYVAEIRCDAPIPVHVAVDWAVTRPKARATGLAGPSRRLIAVRGFLTYLRASNPDVPVPPVRLVAPLAPYATDDWSTSEMRVATRALSADTVAAVVP